MIKDHAECHMRDPFTDSCKPIVKPFIAHSLEIEGRRQQDFVATAIVQNPHLLHGVADRRRRDTADYLAARIDSSGQKRTENLLALGKTDGGALAGGTENCQAGTTGIQTPAGVGNEATIVDR